MASQRVKDESTNDCRIHHPIVGRMDLVNVPLRTPESPDQLLATFYALPGTPSEAALELLVQSLPDRPGTEADLATPVTAAGPRARRPG